VDVTLLYSGLKMGSLVKKTYILYSEYFKKYSENVFKTVFEYKKGIKILLFEYLNARG